jgi:heme exporter protein A
MLNANGLACTRGDRCLFTDVSLTLNPGDWLQVEGENGTGKTSLLRIVCGLLHKEAGEIRWNGQLVTEIDDEYRGNLLYLGHAGAIKEELTALENLRIGAALGGQTLDEAAALDALRRLGLKGREDLPARFLSQGQKRRVALARLLTNQAKLWVLDEPFVALDIRAVNLLCAIIGEHLRAGGMALLTSHQEVNLGEGGRLLRLGA